MYVGTLLKVTVERKKRDNETFSAVTLNIYEQQCNVGKKKQKGQSTSFLLSVEDERVNILSNN